MPNVRRIISAFTLVSLAFAGGLTAAPAPATQPTQPADSPAPTLTGNALNIRAQQVFNRGEYALALPLLKKLAAEIEQRGDKSRLSSVQERIRVCETALKAVRAEADRRAELGLAALPPAADARDNSPERRTPHPAPVAGKTYELSIQSLGNFDYDQQKGGNIPADVMRLNGSVVRLRGYMLPIDQAEDITQFALVPSLFICCLGQPPQIQHTIVASVRKGQAIAYTPDEIQVEGVLRVEEKKDDGYVLSVFELDATSVKLAPK